MELNSIIDKLGFTPGENGLFYKNIGGFLYTASEKKSGLYLSVNLPSVNMNEKRMISCYIKESAARLKNVRFVKDGLIMVFNQKNIDNPEYISEFTKQLSSFLISASIEFSNPELNISLSKGKMYVYTSIAAPIDVPEKPKKKEEEKPDLENENKLYQFIFSNKGLYTVFGVFAVIFLFLCVFYVRIAAASGYIMGWIISTILHHRKSPYIWLKSLGYSGAIMCVSAFVAFIIKFLFQTEIYSIYDYFDRSLTFQNGLYAILVGLIFAAIGVYSTIPQKRNKYKDEYSDF